MGLVTAYCVIRGPGASTLNPAVTLHGRIKHSNDALMPSASTRAPFIIAYILDTDFMSQTSRRMSAMPQIRADLLQQLLTMNRDVSSHIQTFVSLRE